MLPVISKAVDSTRQCDSNGSTKLYCYLTPLHSMDGHLSRILWNVSLIDS